MLSQRTNRRQLIAWTQETTLNGVPDLLHQLDVDRNAAGGIQSERSGAHCFSVMVQFYSETVKQAEIRSATGAHSLTIEEIGFSATLNGTSRSALSWSLCAIRI